MEVYSGYWIETGVLDGGGGRRWGVNWVGVDEGALAREVWVLEAI